MSETTTIRVHRHTRDQVTAAASARRLSYDQLIQQALAALEWEGKREEARRAADRIAADPREQQWSREVMDDMGDLRAG